MQNSATSEHHTPVFNIICYSTPLSLVAPDNQPIFHQAKAPHHRTFSPVINREILQRAARARAVRTLRWLVGSAKGSRWVPGRGPMREVAASNAGRAPDTSRRGAAVFFLFFCVAFSPHAHTIETSQSRLFYFFFLRLLGVGGWACRGRTSFPDLRTGGVYRHATRGCGAWLWGGAAWPRGPHVRCPVAHAPFPAPKHRARCCAREPRSSCHRCAASRCGGINIGMPE